MEVVTFEREDDQNTTTTENSYMEMFDGDSKKLSPHSLLTLLDDKNRSICLLKRQVHNQKVQLSFYLHRVFNSPRIIELAENCVPYETEENIQLNLAMNQFCKQTGMKSRIMVLHTRMYDIEKRIIRTLEKQEDMIHIIVTNIIAFKTSNNDANTIQLCLSQLKKDCGHVEILAKILGATNKLRKELDTFRTCCNRLLVIEDERNCLVEQVYSMPITQRMSYGVLLATQYDKLRLEKEVQEIKQEQQNLQDRFASLNREYSNSENSHVLSSRLSDDQVNLTKMLETVNSEAISLLEITREQKDRYMEEITRLREVNIDLAHKIVSMQEIVNEKEELEARMQLAAIEFQKLREYDQNQLNEFNIKLAAVNEEKKAILNKLEHYNDIDEQMKCLRTQVEDMETVRAQRDYYKLQVDDLQAIRAAYAQLVEHCPARGDEGDSKEQTGKIQVLEKQNHQMSTEIEKLGELVYDQETQIKNLLLIIDKLGSHKDVQTQKMKRTLYSVETTKNIKERKGYASENKSVYSQTDTNMLLMMIKELQSPLGIVSPASIKYKNRNDFGVQTEEETSQTMCDYVPQQTDSILSQKTKIPVAVRGSSLNKSSFTATTSVEVQSVNTEGKSESLKAILESSSPIEGVIEVNNSSSLSLRLTCTPTSRQNTPIDSEEKIGNPSSMLRIGTPMDEYELMKDASRETLAVTLPSVHQKLVAMECVEYTSNDNDRYATEDCFSQLLKRSNQDVDINISRETIPQGNISDEENTDQDNDDYNPDEDLNEIDYEIVNDMPEIKGRKASKVSELTGRLQLITSNLDQTLSQPGGKDSLLNTMKLMYNTFLKDNNYSKF